MEVGEHGRKRSVAANRPRTGQPHSVLHQGPGMQVGLSGGFHVHQDCRPKHCHPCTGFTWLPVTDAARWPESSGMASAGGGKVCPSRLLPLFGLVQRHGHRVTVRLPGKPGPSRTRRSLGRFAAGNGFRKPRTQFRRTGIRGLVGFDLVRSNPAGPEPLALRSPSRAGFRFGQSSQTSSVRIAPERSHGSAVFSEVMTKFLSRNPAAHRHSGVRSRARSTCKRCDWA